MFNKILITLLFFNIGIFSQQAEIFKNPPDNLSLPAILTDTNGVPKTGSMATVESKWVPSPNSNAENLLSIFSTSSEIGIRLMIKNVLASANIPEGKISQVTINFSSSGIEERSIDKDAVIFKDDFAVKYPGESMFLITKLYRTKNSIIELTDGSSADFDLAVKDAISEGLRIGNKTETIQGNKMIIEVPHFTYAYEYVPLNIERTVDKTVSVALYNTTNIGLNSFSTLTVTEGAEYDFFIGIGSEALPKPIELKLSNVNTTASFKIGGKEGYTLTYIEKSGNNVTFNISGYKISFP